MQIGVGFQIIASLAEQWIKTDRIVDKNFFQPKILLY